MLHGYYTEICLRSYCIVVIYRKILNKIHILGDTWKVSVYYLVIPLNSIPSAFFSKWKLCPVSEIVIKLERSRVEELFAPYKQVIGEDLPGYRNHVYRTITYAMYFLNNSVDYEQLVETAFVYHDIGLWSDHELAYLEPSEALAVADNEKYGWGLNADVLRGAIHWHHKVFPYKGPNQNVIEACRKADWIDATKGKLRKGISKAAIANVEAAFPNLGFHDTLLRLAKDYGGSTLVGGFKVMRGIMKW